MDSLLVSLLLFVGVKYVWLSRKRQQEASRQMQQSRQENELKRTLAMGLYCRFKGGEEPLSQQFLKQKPSDLERFCANLLERHFGGSAFITVPQHDFGINLEYTRDGGLYVGRICCEQGDIGYDAIALLHSNMVKRTAKGGYFVTTGGFTREAEDYARGLNIELIPGPRLAELWMMSLETAPAPHMQTAPVEG
nr:restriction endonuclease [Ectobacillus ponti]